MLCYVKMAVPSVECYLIDFLTYSFSRHVISKYLHENVCERISGIQVHSNRELPIN